MTTRRNNPVDNVLFFFVIQLSYRRRFICVIDELQGNLNELSSNDTFHRANSSLRMQSLKPEVLGGDSIERHSTAMKGSSEESIESIRPSNLQAFANISTLHGMSHIFAYGHMTFRRFLWTLSFLGSLGLLMLVCMDRVSYYLEYPHVTKLDEVAATNLTFPAVTFCNLNEFRFSRITRNDLYHVGELLALLNNNYQIANPHLAEPEVLAALKDKANFQNFKPKLFNMTDFYNRTGHDINDMLLQCTFRGEDCYPVNFTTMTAGAKGMKHGYS
ncbi:hypothetical protein L3Q82_006147 [Scortum barcoo]|uniref:Uncharacterized protein n=1 Tax=Scortum barcoo TaxID=214431 RepID=A0ACB8X3I4_9TELE|nr:hypothetical protein L3Q82_006147 [Scortum barcoo]